VWVAIKLVKRRRPIRLQRVITSSHWNSRTAEAIKRIPEEYISSKQQVVMISRRLWQQLGGDPRIIGMTMRLNGQNFTVIGILPTTFDIPSGVDIWAPKAG
jgi:hypothetical protein